MTSRTLPRPPGAHLRPQPHREKHPSCGKRQEPNWDEINEGRTQRVWVRLLEKKNNNQRNPSYLNSFCFVFTSAPSCFHGRR